MIGATPEWVADARDWLALAGAAAAVTAGIVAAGRWARSMLQHELVEIIRTDVTPQLVALETRVDDVHDRIDAHTAEEQQTVTAILGLLRDEHRNRILQEDR